MIDDNFVAGDVPADNNAEAMPTRVMDDVGHCQRVAHGRENVNVTLWIVGDLHIFPVPCYTLRVANIIHSPSWHCLYIDIS
ncbi:unnamed protein product, partial [Ilex paraguariensis]